MRLISTLPILTLLGLLGCGSSSGGGTTGGGSMQSSTTGSAGGGGGSGGGSTSSSTTGSSVGGSSSVSSASSSSAASGGTGGSDSFDCTAVASAGSIVTPATASGQPPAMTGGTIVDGTYALIKIDVYPGASDPGPTEQTIVFQSGHVKEVTFPSSGSPNIIGGPYGASGTTITINAVCPVALSIPLPYTANETSFQLVSGTGSSLIYTYEKK